MKQVFITKDVIYALSTGGGAIANQNAVNLLAPGAIAVFGEDGVLITSANVAVQAPLNKEFFVAVGQANSVDSARYAQPFSRSLVSREEAPYAVATKQSTVLGDDGTTGNAINLPAALVPNTTAFLAIYNRTVSDNAGLDFSMAMSAESIVRYEYRVKASDTAALVLAGVVAEINNNPRSFVTAVANAGLGITLSAKYDGLVFEVTLDEILFNAEQEMTVAATSGSGTPAIVAYQESQANVHRGDSKSTYLPASFFSAGSEVDATKTYDTLSLLYTLAWNKQPAPEVSGQGQTDIYFVVSAAAKTEFLAILTGITVV